MSAPLALAPVRVLVVDDSVVARRAISDVIASDPELQVAGSAAGGRLALAKLRVMSVDAVTLDVEMPEGDGLETLAAIRREWPALPVLMCSSLTERGAVTTLDALARGASDYITKPSSATSGAREAFAADVIAKLKAIARRVRPWAEAPGPTRPAPRPSVRPIASARADIVAIGVSTGGPNALAALMPALLADLAAPVVIVQHMPPIFTRMLADRLAHASGRPVREATDGETLRDGVAYIAPGDFHMRVAVDGTRRVLRLDQGPPENSCRPAVDPLFESVAEVYGPAALGVVLTGMGRDGLRGCERIRAAGGRVLAQDEATSVVWGMPGYVAAAGLAEDVLPLGELAAAIARRARGAAPSRRIDKEILP